MKKIFHFLAAIIVFAFLITGCKTSKVATTKTVGSKATTTAPSETVNEQLNASSLLWKIEGSDIKTSYLLGTFHILKQKDFNLKQHVKDAFAESEQLVLEIDLDDPNMQMDMMQNVVMKDSITIDQLMDEKTYEALNTKLTQNAGVGIQMFNTWQPMTLISMLLKDIVGEQPASFEMALMEMANTQEKELLGLETIKDQLNFFHDIPYKSQASMIEEYLNDAGEVEKGFNKMTEIYLLEDVEALYSFVKEEAKKDDFDMTQLLDQRNANWIPQIKKFATEKSTFFGVGAGHLGGKKGVISLLKEAGFKVSPVTN